MSTGRQQNNNYNRDGTNSVGKKSSIQKSKLSQQMDTELGAPLSPHVQSQTQIYQQNPIDLANPIGSDGDEVKSPIRSGMHTDKSNESMPVCSAQDQSQQSYSYDFLYDPEVAKRGSSASIKQSSNNSVGQNAIMMSPHVFMHSSAEGNDHRMNRSATTSGPGGTITGHDSIMSRGSIGQSQQNRQSTNGAGNNNEHMMLNSGEDGIAVTPYSASANYHTAPAASVSQYDQQRVAVGVTTAAPTQPSHANLTNLTDGQEEQFIEEEYYIEEEIEEEGEEEVQTYTESQHGVDTIKEVSSEQENQSIGNSAEQRKHNAAMGTIMQTASLSAGKIRDTAHFSQSQKRITASDFKEFRGGDNSSSQKESDSNMASLVFKPRDSDVAMFPHHTASMSLGSNNGAKIADSSNKRGSDTKHHFSNPSFGGVGSQAVSKQLPSISNEKWSMMAEKCATRLHTKDLYVQLNKINEVFQRKQVQQEVILGSISQMQLKSFLDISMNSSPNTLLSPSDLDTAHEELREKSLVQIQQDLALVVKSFSNRLVTYFKGESDILLSLAQERERNEYLEHELNAREDRIRPVQSPHPESEDQDMDATEQFITELEAQLQQARSELLSSKLQISDQKVEIENLKLKVDVQSNQVSQFLEERRNIDESFENLRSQFEVLQSEKLELSQMVRDRENAMGPMQQRLQQHQSQPQQFTQHMMAGSSPEQSSRLVVSNQPNHYTTQQQLNSSSHSRSDVNRKDVKRQIESLNRQVFDANKRQESLQMVETNLLEKLDKKELENLELRESLSELQQENFMKGDVIAKAQKIIERISGKSESDENVLKRLNEENDRRKKEVGDKQKVISMLNDQLSQVSAKQNHDHTQMQDTMQKELEEVRNAVREYQLELTSDRHNYMTQVANLEAQLSSARAEKDALAEDAVRREEQTKVQAENQEQTIRELQKSLQAKQSHNHELEDKLKKEVALVQQNASNQIQYLQNRIKEIVEETQQDSPSKPSARGNGLSAQKLKAGNHSLLVTVKKELEGMCKEVLELREALREEGNRGDAIVNKKMSKFDEFRLSVLDQLLLWDEKTAELAGLAERYSGTLDEQKKLFSKLKLIVQEKDQVIVELNRQLIMREQSQEQHFTSMKVELCRSNMLMRDEMLDTISLLEQKALLKEKQALEMEEEKCQARQEFLKLLEERNYFEQELAKVSDRLQFQVQELDRAQAQMAKQGEVYGEILNIRSMQIGQNTIEYALKNLADDCKRYSQEMIQYRDKYHALEKDRDEERKLLNQKVSSLEEQYAAVQKEAIDKDEEQQLEFVERENELVKDLEKAQVYADKTEAELQTRERQLKKIQDKLADDDQKFSDAQAKIEMVAQEKQEALTLLREFEGTIKEREEQIAKLTASVTSSEQLVALARKDNARERQNVGEKLQEIRKLEAVIQERETAIEAHKRQYSELEAKLQHVEQRSMQTSKDLQGVYEDLSQVKSIKSEIEKQNQGLSVEVKSLQHLVEKRSKESQEKEVEIQQYQKTVMRQTREIQENHSRQEIIDGQKQKHNDLDETIKRQLAQIDKLKTELIRPPSNAISSQTIDSGMLELQYARQEVIKSQQCQEVVYQENVQLKEAMQRSSYEVCRLIEDKRELEDLIEKLNKNISIFRSQTPTSANNLMASGKISFDQNINQQSLGGGAGVTLNGSDNNVMTKVLNEKENYIGNLENEIFEMRKEIEIQRDQLLHAEAQTIQAESRQGAAAAASNHSPYMSLAGGNSVFYPQQQQSYNVPSSPQYLQNSTGLVQSIHNGNNAAQQHQQSRQPSNHAPLRQNSQERTPYGGDVAVQDVPYRLQAQTMNYSTMTRSLTPLDNSSCSNNKNKQSGYFQANNSTSMNNFTNNVTQASNTPMNLNQTHHNGSQYGGMQQHRHDQSYLNGNNQSSILMNYQSAQMNNSVTTQDKSYQQNHQSQNLTNVTNQNTSPVKDVSQYGNYVHA